jgi:PAS domain S-box-containing protein
MTLIHESGKEEEKPNLEVTWAQQGEVLYRALFETISDGIMIVNESGLYVEVNESMCRILKAPRSRLIGAYFAEFIPPDLLEAAKTAFGDLKTKGTYLQEFPLRATDGTIVELEWTSRANFVPGLHFCVAREIAEGKKTERELLMASKRLQTNQERLQLATEFARLVVWEWDIATNRVETTANVKEIYGVSSVGYAEQGFSMLHPEDLERHKATIQKALDHGGRYQTEFRIIRPDTKAIVWIEEHAFAILDNGGKVTRLIGVAADITERKSAHLASLHLSAIVASSDDAIISKTLDGVIQSWNTGAERIFGYTGDEIIGKPITTLIPNNKLSEETEIISRIKQGDRIGHYETIRVRKDGTLVDISLTVSPIKDHNGNIIGASKIARDISQWKEAEREREALLAREKSARKEADEANRLKDDFLATVSHELRTPLNAILGWANLLREGGLDPETKETALESIERNAKAQDHLINDLLDISRIIAGKLRLEIRPLNLIPIIEAAISTIRPAAQAKGIELRVMLDSSIGPVVVDADRLQQVVWNILSNAIRFTEKGRIEVFLERADPYVQIRVKDTGIGIAPEFLPYIFDRFRQAEGSSTRSHGGLGLGLAIVKNLVELHGGNVTAESPGEGKGATVTVRFPIRAVRARDEKSPGQSVEEKTLRTSPGLKDLNLLFVDDEAEARRLLKILLERNQVHVQTVASVQEAMQILQEKRPDVIVADIGMPEEDGYSFIERVRAWERQNGLPPIPTIALTAYGRPEDRRKALSMGFDAFLRKPVESADLLASIAKLIIPSFS